MIYNWKRSSGEGQEKASEATTEFLKMIQSPERRIHYAEKFQNFDVAMDVNDLKEQIFVILLMLSLSFFSRLLLMFFMIA